MNVQLEVLLAALIRDAGGSLTVTQESLEAPMDGLMIAIDPDYQKMALVLSLRHESEFNMEEESIAE